MTAGGARPRERVQMARPRSVQNSVPADGTPNANGTSRRRASQTVCGSRADASSADPGPTSTTCWDSYPAASSTNTRCFSGSFSRWPPTASTVPSAQPDGDQDHHLALRADVGRPIVADGQPSEGHAEGHDQHEEPLEAHTCPLGQTPCSVAPAHHQEVPRPAPAHRACRTPLDPSRVRRRPRMGGVRGENTVS
jgi:hypothetical protein